MAGISVVRSFDRFVFSRLFAISLLNRLEVIPFKPDYSCGHKVPTESGEGSSPLQTPARTYAGRKVRHGAFKKSTICPFQNSADPSRIRKLPDVGFVS